MKKIVLFFLSGIVFISCNNNGSGSSGTPKDSTAVAPAAPAVMNYPYTIDHPDNWEMGSSQNTMVALSALKAYEQGNVPESVKYFGDSVHLQFDAYDKTLPADSLKAMFTKMRNELKSMSVKMGDWESVISKDKSEEWVTIWYRQFMEDLKGKKDSMDIIDDMQLKNGKIVRLDEYTRKLH